MSALPKHYYTPEEYLELETKSDSKNEYVSGEIWMMSGASPRHNTIAFNLGGLLSVALRGGPCQGFSSDQRVIVEKTGLRTYPDLAITCDEPNFHSDDKDGLINPTVLFEILSPSTESFDRGLKWMHYQNIPTLTAYLLITQTEPRLEQFVRQDNGTWLYSSESGLEGEIFLPPFGLSLSQREIYERVVFDAVSLPDFDQ